jgi:UDP-N-acetylglucosamine:LPS N-acetylglucosamine transferase
MLGPDHAYTRQFGDFVQHGTKADLLVSTGILSAVQHGIASQGMEVIIAITNPNATPDLTEKTRGATTVCG